MSIISVRNVSYQYHEAGDQAVRNVSFDVEEGEFVAVLGSNGSGKSTLAKLINALFIPSEGTVTVCGMDTRDETKTWDVRAACGMVFQNPDNQIVATIVEEDAAFGLENLGVEPAEIRRRVDWALDAVGMSDYAQSAPHMLSGGQKQRVAIAGVVAMKPRVIVFDESTAMLDPVGRREVMQVVRRLNKEEGINCKLDVVTMKNYRASMDWQETGLPWVQTSPRIPTSECAYLYCITGSLGNGNLSVGIGTGKPFHFVGAPFMDAEQVKKALDEQHIPGIGFRAAVFTPEAAAYARQLVQGVEIYILDKEKANLAEAGYVILQTLRQLYPGMLTFKERGYGLKGYKIDTNLGESSAREGLPQKEVFSRWQQETTDFTRKAMEYKLYR